MTDITNNRFIIRLLTAFLLVFLPDIISAQENGSPIVNISNFGAAVTVQSKGISTIPNLTLGKPAMIFDLTMGRRLTFEPQFRFSLDGKPWAVVLWWRYKLLTGARFTMDLRANSSLAFKTFTEETAEISRDVIRTTRYLAGALTPNYQVNKYLGLGMYLFYSHGIEKYIARNTYMVSFRPSVSYIPVARNIFARVGPEIYYLKIDNNEGVYLNTTLLISKRNFPLSVSALINEPLRSNIPSEHDFLWNVGLSYTFSKKYTEVR